MGTSVLSGPVDKLTKIVAYCQTCISLPITLITVIYK